MAFVLQLEGAAPSAPVEGGPAAQSNRRRRSGALPSWIFVLIIAAATLLRLWQLGSVPLGLHNDEAWTGLNAREVLHDGYIGPYLYPSGLGQPAGPVYFTALLFLVLPQNAFTLRLSMALFGIATIALTYAVGRSMFDRTAGLFAAALLAIMPWHLHLSRIAFLVNSWPFIELAILWVLFRVRRRPTIWGYAAVGALVGLGVYTYNAYALFVPVAAVPFLYDLIAARDRRTRRAWLVRSGAALLTALWAVSLMAHYAARHEEYYWHHRDVSVFNAKAWKEADWPGRANIFVTRAADWATGVFLGGRPDHGDALGERDHPLIDPLTTGAAAVGVLMALAGLRRVGCGVLIAALLTLPWGALLTVNDGLYRRTFGLVPFIALLAALPLAWLWERTRTWGGVARRALRSVLAIAIGVVALRNISDYFGPFQSGPGSAGSFRIRSTPPRAPSHVCRRIRWCTSTAIAGAGASRPCAGGPPIARSSTARASIASAANRTRRSTSLRSRAVRLRSYCSATISRSLTNCASAIRAPPSKKRAATAKCSIASCWYGRADRRHCHCSQSRRAPSPARRAQSL